MASRERWLEPTIERLRGTSANEIIATLGVLPGSVARAIADLERSVPRRNGALVPPDALAVPGYELGEEIGRSTRGRIFRARRRADGGTVALKVMPVTAGSSKHRWLTTWLDRVRSFAHTKLVTPIASGCLDNAEGMWLDLELCRGSALDLVIQRDAPLEWEHACALVLDALETIAVLHQRGLCHGNLNAANLLLRDAAEVLVADARLERLEGGGVGDVWSAAAVLYFLLTLDEPWEVYADQRSEDARTCNPVIPIRDRVPAVPAAIARCVDRVLSARAADEPGAARRLLDELRAAVDEARSEPDADARGAGRDDRRDHGLVG